MARLRAVELIVPAVLEMFIEGRRHRAFRVYKGLPEDVEFVRSYVDEKRGIGVFVFHHPTFEDVPIGGRIPVQDLSYVNDDE